MKDFCTRASLLRIQMIWWSKLTFHCMQIGTRPNEYEYNYAKLPPVMILWPTVDAASNDGYSARMTSFLVWAWEIEAVEVRANKSREGWRGKRTQPRVPTSRIKSSVRFLSINDCGEGRKQKQKEKLGDTFERNYNQWRRRKSMRKHNGFTSICSN